MSRPVQQPKSGFTLIELLVVIAIISLLIQMLLPAVQSTRAAARRVSCANNLRNLGLAAQLYESSFMRLPPSHSNNPNHNFAQFLLPYLEQQALFNDYDFSKDWDSIENSTVIEHELKIFQCPSAPRNYPFVSDYAVCVQVDEMLSQEMVAEGLIRERSSLIGMLRDDERPIALITDGLSNTIVFSEMSGRPDRYELGKLIETDVVRGSRWSDHNARFSLGSRSDGNEFDRGSQLINATNSTEIYSFHVGGVNFVLGDGSVQFTTENIDPDVVVSLITASAGD